MKKRSAKLFPSEEWDFSTVPDSEAELCFVYEYGRSAPEFLNIVPEWRRANSALVDQGERLLINFSRRPKTPAEAAKLRMENQKQLGAWLHARGQAKFPEGYNFSDPRTALLLFKWFPTTAWQRIEENVRKLFWLVCPEAFGPPDEHIKVAAKNGVPPPLPPTGMKKFLLLATQGFDEQTEAQKEIQNYCGAPISDAVAKAVARYTIENHVFAPPLIEEMEGIKLGVVGFIPPSSQRSPDGRIITAEGYTRERATFVINWAATDEEIEAAMRRWIKAHRKGKPFKAGNTTSALEHLRKLGALRVLEAGFTPEKASDKEEFAKLLYRNADQYRRAKRQARDLIAILFPPLPTLQQG